MANVSLQPATCRLHTRFHSSLSCCKPGCTLYCMYHKIINQKLEARAGPETVSHAGR